MTHIGFESAIGMGIETTRDRDRIIKLARQARARGGLVLIDAGCGGLVSLNATGGNLVIAEDPRLGSIDTSAIDIDRQSQVIGFDEKLDAFPRGVKPDLIAYIAPDPGEIASILQEARPIISRHTNILIAFDKTSLEAEYGGRLQGIAAAQQVLKRMGFEVESGLGYVDSFSAQLAKLGVLTGGNISSSHIYGGMVSYLIATHS